MKKHSIWFQSPHPKSNNFNNSSIFRQENEQEPEESHQDKQIYESPQSLNHAIKIHNYNPLSPWSKMLYSEHENKEAHLSLPGILPSNYQPHEVIEQKLLYSDDEDYDPVTPIKHEEEYKYEIQERQINTTGRKTEFEHINEHKKSKPREKGLRKLSQRAYQIVKTLKNATYKEVAMKLVQELNEEDCEGQNKEEQNIKRRVYDALNVLIALGVLKKDGRKIISELNPYKAYDQSTTKEIRSLQDKIKQKNDILEEKRTKWQETTVKLTSVNRLLSRNRLQHENIIDKIVFPFVGINLLSKQQTNQACKQLQNDKIVIHSQCPIQPFGDIDSLKWLHPYLLDNAEQTSSLQ